MTDNSFAIYKSARPRDFVLKRVERPRPEKRGMVVQPVLVGLCGSDYRIYANEKKHIPGVPGHEVAARVVEVGEELSEFCPGDLVTLNPVNPHNSEDIIGYNGQGFLTPYFVVSPEIIEQRRVFRFGPVVDPGVVVFTEPLACCFHGQAKLKDQIRNQQVLVLGAGSFGLLHYLLAKENGAAEVYLAAKSRLRIDLAVEKGIVPENRVIWGDGAALTAMAGQKDLKPKAVIVTANGIAPILEAVDLVAENGWILLFGGLTPKDQHGGLDFYHLRLRQSLAKTTIQGKRVNFIGSYGTNKQDFIRSVTILASGRLNVLPIISHKIPLADLPSLMPDFGHGVISNTPVLKVVVEV